MSLIDRVKGILLEPKNEWPKIAAEPATVQSIYIGYVMILAAIGPIALLLRGAVIGAVIGYAVALASIYVLAFIVDALAPTFSAEKNFVQSLKLAAYSYTAPWVAGIFLLIPFLGRIIGLLAAIYAFYTFYVGLPVVKKCPADKAVGYTIVVVVCGIVIWLLLAGVLTSMVVGGSILGMMGPGMFH